MRDLVQRHQNLKPEIKQISERIKIIDAWIDYAEPYDDAEKEYLSFADWCKTHMVCENTREVMISEMHKFNGDDEYDKALEYQDYLDGVFVDYLDLYDDITNQLIDKESTHDFSGQIAEHYYILGLGNKKKQEERKAKRHAKKEARQVKRQARKDKRVAKREAKKVWIESGKEGGRKAWKETKKEIKEDKKAIIRRQRDIIMNSRTGVGKFVRKGLNTGKKVLLTPQRNSFLALTRLNAGNIAGRLNELMLAKKGTPEELAWTKFKRTYTIGFSGSIDSLTKAINAGKDKKALTLKFLSKRSADGITTHEAWLGIDGKFFDHSTAKRDCSKDAYYYPDGVSEGTVALVSTAIGLVTALIGVLKGTKKGLDVDENSEANLLNSAVEENEALKKTMIADVMNNTDLSDAEKEILITEIEKGGDISAVGDYGDDQTDIMPYIYWGGGIVAGALIIFGVATAIKNSKKNK